VVQASIIAAGVLPSARSKERVGALITGADYRGLGLVRSLGRKGIPVCVLTHDDHWLARFSRFARRTFCWPPGSEDQRAEFLVRLAKKHGLRGWVLLPTDDDAVSLVARHHEQLAPVFQLTTPPWNQLCRAVDKRLLHRLAADLGIDQPWTYCPRNRDDIETLTCSFPVIIKPAIHERRKTVKAWRADSREALLARYAEACTAFPADALLIQEMIPGGGEAQFSYSALCRGGYPLAWATARRVRQYPMDFGQASTHVETVDEPALVEPSVRLLQALGITGIIEIEFKRDPRDRRFKLLDVNPRVWGWQTLCGRAGVDFPYLLWRLVHGQPVPALKGRAGVRWVRMCTDLPTALREMGSGRLSLIHYLRSLAGPIESAIFAYDDPLPGLFELPLLAYVAGKRLLRRRTV
jgi:predicted ATP-grasp superfamily ATP-dependent carboligase